MLKLIILILFPMKFVGNKTESKHKKYDTVDLAMRNL